MKPRRSWDTEGKGNKLYGRRWRNARAAFLAAHPLCCMCHRAGTIVSATVVDHIIPHRGDERLFWDAANWQPLCEAHHNGEKAVIESRGFSNRIGIDGWPADPAHPANVRGVGGVSPNSREKRAPSGKSSKYLVSNDLDNSNPKNQDVSFG